MCLAIRFFTAALTLGQLVLLAQPDPFLQLSRELFNADLFLVATDPGGNIVVAGRTNEAFREIPANAYQRTLRGGTCQGRVCNDVLVAKLRPADGAIVAATLLGGTGDDSPTAISVDQSGNVYVVGTTTSRNNFPTHEGAFQRNTTASSTGFVTKLNSTLTDIQYSTYLGGNRNDLITSIAVDVQGFAYIAGTTESSDFPITGAAYQKTHAPGMIFVARLNTAGSALAASTFLAPGSAANIGIDLQGMLTIAGTTTSAAFPVTQDAVQPRINRVAPFTYSDGFVARMSAGLNSLIYSTYFGGSLNDTIIDARVDRDGTVYVAGNTFSRDFPLTITDSGIGGTGTAFVAKFTLPRVAYARALRGSDSTAVLGLEVSPGGAVNVTGLSSGTHYPTTSGAYRRCVPSKNRSGPIPFYSRLDRDGAFTYSTLFHEVVFDSRQWAVTTGSGELIRLGFVPSPDTSPTVQTSLPINLVQRVNLQASAPAAVECVVNAATYAPAAVSPGLIVTIFGSGIGPVAGVGGTIENGRVTTTAGGVRVFFDGAPAPILYARQDQVNAIVPFSVGDRATTQMIVEYNEVRAPALAVPVRAALPGVFRIGATEQAVILNEDGTVNSPENPAARGSIVTFWITGFGHYETAASDGLLMGGDLSKVRLPVAVTMQNAPAELLYAGSAPGMVAGAAQVNVRVPLAAPASLRVPIGLLVGGDAGQFNTYISLK
jgi:uncharacterized protein (TIGR03437 family)